MNIRFFSFLLVFVFACTFFAAAQSKATEASKTSSSSTSNTKKNPLEKLRVGGNLSGGISNDFYFLTVAPRISMEVTKWFVPGATVTYMYSQETGGNRVTTNTYGAGVFTDFYPIKYVFGHVEYQHLWYTQKIKGITPVKQSFDDDFLLMGAGVKVPVGAKTSMFASVLFNVLNNERSEYYMYKNPIYSVGIDVGL